MKKSEEIVIMLRRIIRATDMRSKKLARESGLTPPQFMVLSAIAEMGNVAISNIANTVNLTQATVTTIIDRLEDKKLVARIRSEQDKRIVHATLTDAGRKKFPKHRKSCKINFWKSITNWLIGNKPTSYPRYSALSALCTPKSSTLLLSYMSET